MLTSEESFQNNYGAVLQGYALNKTLSDLGLKPIVVRYLGGEIDRNRFTYRVFCIKRFLGKQYRRLLGNRNIRLEALNKEKVFERELLFLEFQKDSFLFWNEKRITWPEIRKSFPYTDYYICGSDQIWNPYFKRGYNDPGYFLAFAPKGARKISYAPSFGGDDIPDRAKRTLKKLLQDFRAISVRESSGVDIIEKYAGFEAKHVLDPTMLVTPEKWREISRLPKGLPDKYILSYRFGNSERIREVTDGLSRKTGIPIVSLPLSDVSVSDPYIKLYKAGPREFIGLIDHAALVCTDSFHATVFSILMKTPVCVFQRESYQNGHSMNTRIESLLDMFDLRQLMFTETENCERAAECFAVDFQNAHLRLAQLRNESMEFLINALER